MKRAGLMILAIGLLFFAQVAQADWTPPKRLASFSNWSNFGYPAIATDSKNAIHVVWMYGPPDGDILVYYRRSSDGGTTWSWAKSLTGVSGLSEPRLAIDSQDTIYLFWESGNEIYYRRSQNGGITWDVLKRLTWTAGRANSPAIAIDSSDTIHVVYQHREGISSIPINLWYKRSQDGGTTWSTDKRLTWDPDINSVRASVAIGPNNHVHVVWTKGLNSYEIFYKRSTDGGTTWGVAKRLTWSSGDDDSPDISIDSGNAVHVVWSGPAYDDEEIYYKRSADGGTTWGPSKRLTWTLLFARYPAMAIDSTNTIHIVWTHKRQDMWKSQIYYRKSGDGGATWSTWETLTQTLGGAATSPGIAIDSSDNIHVVWSHDSSYSPDGIFYTKGK